MTIHFKTSTGWGAANKVYYKTADGIWKPVKRVWRKTGASTWSVAHEYDEVPPNPPEVSLELRDNRFIRAGVRIPGAHVSDLKRIRLLVSRDNELTTQFGTGFISTADDSHPWEPWSEFFYNAQNPAGAGSGKNHPDSSEYVYKQYPVNPTENTDLPAGKSYYFGAWAQDQAGNWSAGTMTRIFKPKSDATKDRVIVKETRFQANNAGSAGLNGAGYIEGQVIQQQSPRKNGFFFYGYQIDSAIAAGATIKMARIRLTRTNDTGQPLANVNIFWHTARNPDAMPVLDADHHETTTIGTINKGETKWFDLPAGFLRDLRENIRGLGLSYGIQATDYLVLSDIVTDLRNGELHVAWEESL